MSCHCEVVCVFCFIDATEDTEPDHNEFLFPEYEILIEPEEPEFPADSTVDPDDEKGAGDASKKLEKQEESRVTSTTSKKYVSSEACVTSLKRQML